MSDESLKSKTKKGLYWKFAEQFSNYGVQFIIGIFMARMLSPEDFGLTALPAVFLSISAIFIDSGFSGALIRKTDLTERDLSTAFIYSMCVGIFCYLALFVSSPWIAAFYNAPILESIVRVTALSFLYSPLNTVQTVILRRNLNFKTPAKIAVFCRIIAGVVGITLAYTGYGVWALVLSSLVSGIIGVVITWSVVRWKPTTGWSSDSFKYLWGYGNKMMGSIMIGTIYENIAPIIIGKYYNAAQLGVYNRAVGYAQMPSQNIVNTLQSVTFPVLSKIQDDSDKLQTYYRKMLKVSAFIVFPVMMILAALAHPLIILMVTEKWESSVILLQLLCFSYMWYPIHAINLNLLQVKGRTDLFFRLEIIKRCIGLLVLCTALPFGLVAFCSAGIASSYISLFLNTFYTGKLIGIGFMRQMKDLFPTLILSFVMFAVTNLAIHLIDNMLWQVVIGLAISISIYLSVAYLCKFSELKEALYLLNKKN